MAKAFSLASINRQADTGQNPGQHHHAIAANSQTYLDLGPVGIRRIDIRDPDPRQNEVQNRCHHRVKPEELPPPGVDHAQRGR